MKAATLIGVILAIASLLLGALIEGVALAGLIKIPAILIVLGGTFGATMAACGMDGIRAIPVGFRRAFRTADLDLAGRVRELVGHAERARKDGMLALESEIEAIDDPFTRNGLQLVVDGTEPELVREVLESEIEGMEHRHRAVADPFVKAGAFAPTIGIVGTVLSLLHVLANLADPESIGPAVAGAFVATLLGVGTANVLYFPVGNRLQKLSAHEAAMRTMVLEGILAIQAGDNPRLVMEKLLTFLPPAERDAVREPEAVPSLHAVDDPTPAAAAA